MNEEKEILEGKVQEDVFGSYDDCSPGTYIGDNILASSVRNGFNIFNKYIGKRIRVTIEVIPDEAEAEEDEPTVNFTIGQILNKGVWSEFCEYKGWNEWIINEGRADKNETVRIPLSKAKQLGLI